MENQVNSTAPESSSTALHASNHLESFEAFFQHVNQAAKSVFPKTPRRYKNVFVLLLRWEDDDLGTKTEIDDLAGVFQDIYHYNVERYQIPSINPASQLEYKLTDFRRAYESPDNLLLLYYGGHGSLDRTDSYPVRSIWQANVRSGMSLVWSDLQGVLERAESDVVFILDCCFAASASRCAGSKEGLWACNSAVTTTGVNNNSFTRNIIEELRSLSGTRFNIAMLHARLMKRYRKPGKHMLITEPWYTYLGNTTSPSAELLPLPQSRTLPVSSMRIDRPMTETLVLLAVRLKDAEQVPGHLLWEKWCHELAPDDIESVHALGRLRVRDLIRFEAHYLSNSSLILVSMAIYVWDRLPISAAYSFVGFIKSTNMMMRSRILQSELTSIPSTNIGRSTGATEPVTSAGLAKLVLACLKTVSSLLDDIRQFKKAPHSIPRLSKELRGLTDVLNALLNFIHRRNINIAALDLPLRRCFKNCQDFQRILDMQAGQSDSARSEFQEWAKIQWLDGGISEFVEAIASYRSTISVALFNAKLRVSWTTQKGLDEFEKMISSTTHALESRLRHIHEKLPKQALGLEDETKDGSLRYQSNLPQREFHAEEEDLLSEIEEVSRCIQICEEAASEAEKNRYIAIDLVAHDPGSQITVSTVGNLTVPQDTEQLHVDISEEILRYI